METIREALKYVQTCLDNPKGPSIMMAKIMLENVLVNLEDGKTIDDPISF